MSVMSDLDLQLAEVREAMQDQPMCTQLEYKLDRIIVELDELVSMSANPDRRQAVIDYAFMIGQLYSRACLLQSFLLAAHAPTLKVIRGRQV